MRLAFGCQRKTSSLIYPGILIRLAALRSQKEADPARIICKKRNKLQAAYVLLPLTMNWLDLSEQILNIRPAKFRVCTFSINIYCICNNKNFMLYLPTLIIIVQSINLN